MFLNGAASIFAFDVKGTREQMQKLIGSLKIFSILANVADMKLLIIRLASIIHLQLTDKEMESVGIYPTTIRIFIGAENSKNLIADLKQACKGLKLKFLRGVIPSLTNIMRCASV